MSGGSDRDGERGARTIRATLGSKLVANAATFFRNDAGSMLDELVQNARRAGATRIDFALRGGDLMVEDDGTGLAKEDAEVLLALGSSANGGGIERDEAAAGIGFFALAHHVVHVRTQDWRCTIEPANFVGEGEVEIHDGLPDAEGMALTIVGFYLDGRYADDLLVNEIVHATRHSGLRGGVRHSAGRYHELEPEPFLGSFDRRQHFVGSRVDTLPGARIRVVRFADAREEDEGDEDEGGREPLFMFNFFGKSLAAGAECSRLAYAVPGRDVHAAVTPGSGRIHEVETRTCVLVDVTDTRSVRLRLPDRDAVVDEPRLDALARAAADLFAEMIRETGAPHGIHGEGRPGLGAPTIKLAGRGRGATDLMSRPSAGDPATAEVVDADGFAVDVASLRGVPWCVLIDLYATHAVKTADGAIVRLVDEGRLGLLDPSASVMTGLNLVYDELGSREGVDAPSRVEATREDYPEDEIYQGLVESHGVAHVVACRGIALELAFGQIEDVGPDVGLDMGGGAGEDPSGRALVPLDGFVIGSLIDRSVEGTYVLTTPGVDVGRLTTLASNLANRLMEGCEDDFEDDFDDEVEEMANAMRGAVLKAAPGEAAWVARIEELVAEVLERHHLDGRAMELSLSIGSDGVRVRRVAGKATRTRAPRVGPARGGAPTKRGKPATGK